VSCAFFGTDNLLIQVVQVGATDIAQLNSLEILPNALIWVEIGSIIRKLFQMQSLGGPSFEKSLDLVVAMDRGAVPDDKDLARNLA
jgi:hypothetical protein